jgi:hypothetical protein
MEGGSYCGGRRWWHRIRPWVIGVVASVIVLGPGLGRGQLLNIDLVSTPRLRLPDWRWGVGPGVPHRVPLYFPLSVMSHVIDGATVTKLLYVVTLTALFAGVWRLAATGNAWVDGGVALVVAWSPFTTTRVGVGHSSVVWAMAAVAWSATALLRLDPARRHTTRSLVGLAALGGLVPGLWTMAMGAFGVVAGPVAARRERARQWLLLLPLQLVWLVPSALFALVGPRLVGGRAFRPVVNAAAPLQFLAGLGFWRTPSQVAPPPWWPAVSVALAVLAISGWSAARTRLGRGWSAAAVVAIAVPLAAVVPLMAPPMRWLTTTAIGAPLRESQRWWGLGLVLLAPSFASGAIAVSRRFASVVPSLLPLAAALFLGGNGLWGVGGSLKPALYPAGWSSVATILDREPGTSLVLPWHQYLDVPFAGGRRVLNPFADFLPGDLVFSTDPELGVAQGQIDPRATPAIEAISRRDSAAAALAALGIRYVALARFGPVDERADQLEGAPGLSTVFSDTDVTLLSVDDSVVRPIRWWFGPFGAASAGTEPLAVPYGRGWMQGWHAVSGRGPLVDPGEGGGILWYWPSVVVVLGDLAAVLWWARSLVNARRAQSDLAR